MTIRVDRNISSVDNRAEARVMTSIAVSQNGNRSRKNSRKSSNEVDAVGNPTELFRRINSGDWEGALNAVKTNPVEASIWVSRRK